MYIVEEKKKRQHIFKNIYENMRNESKKAQTSRTPERGRLSCVMTKGVVEGVTQSELYHRYEEEGLKGG